VSVLFIAGDAFPVSCYVKRSGGDSNSAF
jgi:hypothetical protein